MKIERIKSIIRPPWRRGFLLILFTIAGLALLPQARAVCQEGCDSSNTFLGDDALLSNKSINSTAIGSQALHNNFFGSENTAVGAYALYSNSGLGGAGQVNTATGAYALYSNSGTSRTNGSANTADGAYALYSNTDGQSNTSNGHTALYHNTTGDFNTATGAGALGSNTTANYNTANGVSALANNTSGFQNTATGAGALGRNGTGNRNVAEGYAALSMNRTGNFNTAVGFQALFQNGVGSNNVALGFNAGSNLTTSVSVTMLREWLARVIRLGSEIFSPQPHLAGQFTSIPTIRSARMSPRDDSRRKSDPWTRPATLSWRLNRSPSVIKKRLNPMAASCLDLSPKKWNRSIPTL